MINVLVTGVGSLIGEGIIRSIKSSSLRCRIIGTDYFPNAVGLYWVDKGYILPDILRPETKKADWVNRVIDIIKKEDVQIVLIGLDFEVKVFAEYKEKIEKETKAKIIVGSQEAVAVCSDKWKTSEFLKENGFPYPKSSLPEERNVFIQENGFPLVVKPRFGFRSRNFSIVNNVDEINKAIEACDLPVIQEVLGAPDKEYTCGSVYLNEEVFMTISLRRDLKDGNTWRAYCDEDSQELNDFIHKVAEKLKLYGSANFQLRKTEKGPVIFEINPRFSGTTPIRALFGCNEVELIIRAVVEGHYEKKEDVRQGVVLRYMDEQFVSWNEYKGWA